MEKHSRCVTGICLNGIQPQELHKKHSNVNGDTIMHKLLEDGTVKNAWTHAILKGRKQAFQESLHTFVTASLLG